MNWRFWKKGSLSKKEETILKYVEGISGCKEFYVCTQSPDKAEELMKKLRDT